MSVQDCEQLTSFQEDSPASRSVWLESRREKGMTVTYGRKCSELSGNLRRVGLSVRMYLESCGLPLPTLYRTWSVKDITSSCLILKLRLSARPTGGSGSRLWPTAATQEAEHPNAVLTDAGRRESKAGSSSHSMNLADTVRLWGTPTARDCKGANSLEHLSGGRHLGQLPNMVRIFPTPTTGAGLCGGTGNFQQLQSLKEDGIITEGERRNMSQGNGGQLNPVWVEWLMGYPPGWTDLNA